MLDAWKMSRALSKRPLFRSYSVTTQGTARDRLLKTIYAPFLKLDKKSEEYARLAKSGDVWYQYFEPGNTVRYGYDKIQQDYKDVLKEIDDIRAAVKTPVSAVSQAMIAEYAYQSTEIEFNRLKLGDSLIIKDSLEHGLFKHVDFASTAASQLKSLSLPATAELLPGKNSSETAELRNHIIACQWIVLQASMLSGTSGMQEEELKALAALLVRDTKSEANHKAGWGGQTALGDYRHLPIQTKGVAHRVYPYHVEVPALMQRFFDWRNDSHNTNLLHPLILACQSFRFFLYIHPFLDGNGRAARLLMQDYLIRQGYFPVIFQGFDRREYLQQVSDAQDGNPRPFVDRVVLTQLDMMRTILSA